MNKNYLWLIVSLCVLLLVAIAKNYSDLNVLQGIVAIAVMCSMIWLFSKVSENKNMKMNRAEQLIHFSKKIFVIAVSVLAVVCIAVMMIFAISDFVTSGNLQGVYILLIVTVIVAACIWIWWYIHRWRKWWVKFLRTFNPKDSVWPEDWKVREKCYQIYDNETSAMYGLRSSDGIFYGRTCVWLDVPDVDASAMRKLEVFATQLHLNGINGSNKLYHTPGCIYANIVCETDYKTMNKQKQIAFREAFGELDKMNYHGEYYVSYHGELGTIFFECMTDTIIRAVRTEPIEEFYLDLYYRDNTDNVCGFRSEEAQSFIERGIDWGEGSYSLISRDEFFSLWHDRLGFVNVEDAYLFFMQASFMYFAAVANRDENEQTISRWTIEAAARYLIGNDDREMMIVLLEDYDQPAYWAARLFREFVPDEAYDAAVRIAENCDDPAIVSATEELLKQWNKPIGIC